MDLQDRWNKKKEEEGVPSANYFVWNPFFVYGSKQSFHCDGMTVFGGRGFRLGWVSMGFGFVIVTSRLIFDFGFRLLLRSGRRLRLFWRRGRRAVVDRG